MSLQTAKPALRLDFPRLLPSESRGTFWLVSPENHRHRVAQGADFGVGQDDGSRMRNQDGLSGDESLSRDENRSEDESRGLSEELGQGRMGEQGSR